MIAGRPQCEEGGKSHKRMKEKIMKRIKNYKDVSEIIGNYEKQIKLHLTPFWGLGLY